VVVGAGTGTADATVVTVPDTVDTAPVTVVVRGVVTGAVNEPSARGAVAAAAVPAANRHISRVADDTVATRRGADWEVMGSSLRQVSATINDRAGCW
jgi:hypothetical protein